MDRFDVEHHQERCGQRYTLDANGQLYGVHLYAYAGGDPINLSDPSGLDVDEWVTVIGHRRISGLIDFFDQSYENPNGGGGEDRGDRDRCLADNEAAKAAKEIKAKVAADPLGIANGNISEYISYIYVNNSGAVSHTLVVSSYSEKKGSVSGAVTGEWMRVLTPGSILGFVHNHVYLDPMNFYPSTYFPGAGSDQSSYDIMTSYNNGKSVDFYILGPDDVLRDYGADYFNHDPPYDTRHGDIGKAGPLGREVGQKDCGG